MFSRLRSCIAVVLCPAFFQLDRENKIAGVIPRLVFNDKSTYVKSSTKVYDDVSPHSTAILHRILHSLHYTQPYYKQHCIIITLL